jgi:prepilin-type N-terminal cleavage/methylation domain-containing protein
MRDTMKNHKYDGYTLIELAVVIIILGLLIAPAFGLYGLYMKNQRNQQTESAMQSAQNAIGGFRSLYGRYPCPAPANAVPGSAEYGYEDCTATAPGVTTATSANVALANRDVLIGSLPFRQLNMQEPDSIDGYGTRLSYAVTRSLTDSATFDTQNGGISVVDINDSSLVTPPDSAHFIIISAGPSDVGARTREGVQTEPCPGAGPEAENCNGDSVFRVSSLRADFDDQVAYNMPVAPQMWQYAVADPSDIHLVSANSIALGVGVAAVTFDSSAVFADIREQVAGDAVIRASSGGAFMSTRVCNYAGDFCFPPDTISGQNVEGEGLSCPPGQFMIAIENNMPICRPEIWFSCPAGEFVAGINSSGNLICDTMPPPACASASMTTACGSVSLIPAALSGGNSYAYSGTCHRLPAWGAANTAAVSAMTTTAQVDTYVATLNATARTVQNCGSSATTALVRDAYRCDAGTWSLLRTTERGNTTGTNPWSSDPAAGNVAETSVPFSPFPYDSAQTNGNHDCWCREDYRRVTPACTSGVGLRFQIQRHACPRTSDGARSWTTVYDSGSTLCTCVPTTTTSTTPCTTHFGVPSNSMTGNVTRTYNNTCVSGVLVTDPTPTVDVSACRCPARADVIGTAACPAGTTNSFTYSGVPYTSVAQITRDSWVCPAGAPPTPATSPADAGYFSGPVVVHTESCACDSSLTAIEFLPCPAGQLGPGLRYRKEWNCVAGDWEPQADWEFLESQCTTCRWQKPGGTPDRFSVALGGTAGATCYSCGAVGLCHESAGGGQYDVWTGCSCGID